MAKSRERILFVSDTHQGYPLKAELLYGGFLVEYKGPDKVKVTKDVDGTPIILQGDLKRGTALVMLPRPISSQS